MSRPSALVLTLGALLTCGVSGDGWARTAASAANAAPTAPTAADWRTPDPQNVLVIDTNRGRIIIELAPKVAPQSAARMRDLARAGFYDGRAFFRVIDNFMDQTGDPTDTGAGGSTQPNLPPEFTLRRDSATGMVAIDHVGGMEAGFVGSLPVTSQTLDLAALTADQKVAAWASFCSGVVGMARAQDPASGNSQFFLMRGDNGSLDQKYTAVGRVVSGMDVVRAIKTGEPVEAPQDKMVTVRVLADIPAAQRPRLRLVDAASPWFTEVATRMRAAKSNGFSTCELEFPVDLK
jgi:peptidylprolyl isomerase